MQVSLVRYEEGNESLKKALEMCNGLKSLNKGDRILIKPNAVTRGAKKQPPHGMTTSPQILTELLTLLKDIGCNNITIGEGSILLEEMRLNTERALVWSGIQEVADKFEVEICDFNEGNFTDIDFQGEKIQVNQRALEVDFFINLPVLKTHYQATVSIGIKNLKGCLSFDSKKKFHRLNLDNMIAKLGTKIPHHLIIIDGIYALERGPLLASPLTKPHKLDLLVAGTDTLAVDMVGAEILGYSVDEVPHLKRFAEITGRNDKIDNIEILGEKLSDIRHPLEYNLPVSSNVLNVFEQASITGIYFPDPDASLCSGCGYTTVLGCMNFTRSAMGKKFNDVYICAGSKVKPPENSKNIVLLGSCAIKNNKSVNNTLKVKGCPPSSEEVTQCLEQLKALS